MAGTFRFTDTSAAAAAAIHGAAAGGLHDGAEYLLEQANRTVPIEEGTLERSGKASVDEAKLEAAVSYDTPYAARQHEETRYRHDPGRRAKWLERTMVEQGDEIFTVVGHGMRGRMP